MKKPVAVEWQRTFCPKCNAENSIPKGDPLICLNCGRALPEKRNDTRKD